MKVNIQQYLLKTSPNNKKLDNKLTPILQSIRDRNIISFRQIDPNRNIQKKPSQRRKQIQRMLSNRPSKEKEVNIKNRRRLTKMANPQTTIYEQSQQFSNKNHKESQNRDSINILGSNFNSTYSTNIPKNTEVKFFESSLSKTTSKINKHLVEEIDLKEIEKAFYKKPQKVNRFQLFCQKIRHNHRSQPRSQNEERIGKNFERNVYDTMDNNLFRIIQKKKSRVMEIDEQSDPKSVQFFNISQMSMKNDKNHVLERKIKKK